jgi:hypothetical protein
MKPFESDREIEKDLAANKINDPSISQLFDPTFHSLAFSYLYF